MSTQHHYAVWGNLIAQQITVNSCYFTKRQENAQLCCEIR